MVKNKSATKLLVFDKSNSNIVHHKRIKVTINKITKEIIVKTLSENGRKYLSFLQTITIILDAKEVVIKFDRKIIQQKNIIFIFSSNFDSNNYVVILPSENICKKVFNAVVNKSKRQKITNNAFPTDDNVLLDQFIHPIIQNFASNKMSKSLMTTLMKSFENEQKQKLIKFCKEKNFDFGDFINELSEDKNSNDIRSSQKKSKISRINWQGKVIDSKNYKIFEILKSTGARRKRLIIFPLKDNQKLCYDFYWNATLSLYFCSGCYAKKKYFRARMFEDFLTGKECIKILSRFHDCEMREFDPKKYESDTMEQIVEAPNFILHKFVICGKMKQRLVIFDSTNKNLCYEYFWDNKEKCFLCCECNNNGHRRRVLATIRENCDGEEYVRLNKLEHVCDLREYDPEKFKNDIVFLPSNFKIIEYIENGLTKKKLYLFPSNSEDKNLCYKFAPDKIKFKISVYAKLIKPIDDNGEEEYIELSQCEHKCEPRKFEAEKYVQKILRKPDFIFGGPADPRTTTAQIIIFDSNNRELCYFYGYIKEQDLYSCRSCYQNGKFVTAKHLKDENGEDFLQLNNAKHICKPKLPKKMPKIVKSPNFIHHTCKIKSFKRRILIILSEEDKNLCYKFCYRSAENKKYLCMDCKNRGISVTATLKKDKKDGEEFVQFNDVEHVCKPKKYNPKEFDPKTAKH